jgi:GWxTD domain-containing protein
MKKRVTIAIFVKGDQFFETKFHTVKNAKALKYLIYLTTLLLFVLFSVKNSCGSIRAYLNYTFFNSPGKGPYIETYLAIDGTSVTFNLTEENLYQASVNVSMVFRQDTSVISFDKYDLLSDKVSSPDGEDIIMNIIDMQRYFLPQGSYEFEIILIDNNTEDEPFSAVQPLEIKFEEDVVNLSGIQLVDSIKPAEDWSLLTKSGYDLFPKVFNYFPANDNILRLYTEVYNLENILGENERFLIKTQISSFESSFVLENFAAFKRAETKPVYPHYHEFDISDLPTGSFILTVEIVDRDNRSLAVNSLFFQRDNPDADVLTDQYSNYDIDNTFVSEFTNEDTLTEYIRSLAPKGTHSEKKFIYKGLDNADFEKKKEFFYRFWYLRDREDPQGAWLEYQELVMIVNEHYSTQVSKGYETDRGRVYLKYGPPNAIAESYNEPSAYPYEIWHYYKLGFNQSNKRFVFYSNDFITNNFELLHSDAIGELSNPRWEIIINSRWYDPYGVDNFSVPEIWGGEASDFYRNPR